MCEVKTVNDYISGPLAPTFNVIINVKASMLKIYHHITFRMSKLCCWSKFYIDMYVKYLPSVLADDVIVFVDA